MSPQEKAKDLLSKMYEGMDNSPYTLLGALEHDIEGVNAAKTLSTICVDEIIEALGYSNYWDAVKTHIQSQ